MTERYKKAKKDALEEIEAWNLRRKMNIPNKEFLADLQYRLNNRLRLIAIEDKVEDKNPLGLNY